MDKPQIRVVLTPEQRAYYIRLLELHISALMDAFPYLHDLSQQQ